MKSKKNLHVTICFDRGYLVPFYALSCSIFENNKSNFISIHAFISGLSIADKEEIQEFASTKNGAVYFYEVQDDFTKDFPAEASFYGPATFYRLLAASYLPADIKSFLYLDTDVIVTADLSELFDKKIDGFPVAAVSDAVLRTRPQVNIYNDGGYFNAGVLFINRQVWLEQKISERVIEFLKSNHDAASYGDQDALNAILACNWIKLDAKFNLMPDYVPRDLKGKDASAFGQDKIIHYAQFYKPWHYLCNNRLRFLYTKYLAMTPKSAAAFGTRKKTWNGIKLLLKLRARELYYDYPIIPLNLMDRLRGFSN